MHADFGRGPSRSRRPCRWCWRSRRSPWHPRAAPCRWSSGIPDDLRPASAVALARSTIRQAGNMSGKYACQIPLPGSLASLHVRQGAHFILVSVDEQFLQQRVARVLAERLLQILLGLLDRREAGGHLGARRRRHRIQLRLQRRTSCARARAGSAGRLRKRHSATRRPVRPRSPPAARRGSCGIGSMSPDPYPDRDASHHGRRREPAQRRCRACAGCTARHRWRHARPGRDARLDLRPQVARRFDGRGSSRSDFTGRVVLRLARSYQRTSMSSRSRSSFLARCSCALHVPSATPSICAASVCE